jgi:hypothetical protein
MANVKKLLSQLEHSTGEEIEQLSADEAEEIGGGMDVGCKHNTGCGPNTSCGPTPAPAPTEVIS